MKVGIHDLSYVNQYFKGGLTSLSERKRNAKHPVFTQLIIALSTFKYKLKNFLIYAWVVFCCFGADAKEENEGFRSKHFLELPDEHKKFWLDGAITAFAHIAAARDKTKGECVYNWYFSEQIGERNWLILESMKKYPTATPTAVLLAITERECGAYRN